MYNFTKRILKNILFTIPRIKSVCEKNTMNENKKLKKNILMVRKDDLAGYICASHIEFVIDGYINKQEEV